MIKIKIHPMETNSIGVNDIVSPCYYPTKDSVIFQVEGCPRCTHFIKPEFSDGYLPKFNDKFKILNIDRSEGNVTIELIK